MKGKVILVILAIACLWQASPAQSAPERILGEQTTGFSYQGSLKNAGAPANGNHDFEFRLWDSASGGAQIGTTISLNGVAVTNGLFAVTLDFGNQYPDTSRFLEVRVRPTGGGAFTALTPREQIKAVPYAVKSLNTEQLGGVAASQYVTTTTGGANFIQNTTTQQASSNFNIDGTGNANIFNAATQYSIGFNRILSSPNGGANLFVGVGAGPANPMSSQNAFFGRFVGQMSTTGGNNAFFGHSAGQANTTGSNNAFFGTGAGFFNTAGGNNAFFGRSAGESNTTGSENTYLGNFTSASNLTGSGNTMIGYSAFAGNGINNAIAIGNRAMVATSNSLVLGGVNGFNGVTWDTNVGIGTTTPQFRLHVRGENIRVEGNTNSTLPRFSLNFTGGGADEKKWQNYATTSALVFSALNDSENAENIWMRVNRGTGMAISNVEFLSNVGIGVPSSPDMLAVGGTVSISFLGLQGSQPLCRNFSNQIALCSSSLRYKTNVGRFSQGMSFIDRLHPISFEWKADGLKDIGFGAEDIARIDPRFVTYNSAGEVEGVKYDRLSVAFVNAFKEQQAEISELRAVSSEQAKKIDDQTSRIEDQKAQIERQRKELDALKKLVCLQNPTADVCQP